MQKYIAIRKFYGGSLMENEIVKLTPKNLDITVDASFDFKLDGWPASAVLITLCLSGVMIYTVKAWLEKV